MSSALSSIRSSPIPDLAYDSYRSLSLRDQTLIRRQLASAEGVQPPPPPMLSSMSHHQPLNNGHGNGNTFSSQQQPSSSSNSNIPGINYRQNISSLDEPTPPNLIRSRSTATSHREPQSTTANAPQVKRRPSSFFVTNGKAYNLDNYGGESLAFWILLGILCLLVVGNSILTFLVFGVIRVGVGMESIEFLPGKLKFYGETDLGEIYKRDGILQGFDSDPIEITGHDGGEVHLWTHAGSQPSLSVERTAINISSVTEFRIVDRKGREVFSTNTPTLGLPRGVQKLDVRVAKVNRITSAVNASLQLVSTTFTYLKGSEGTHLEGRQITFKADQDILLKSVTGSIILSGGKDGIYLNVHDLPLVRETAVTRKSHTVPTLGKKESQYQLCACMPSGKLYRVEIPLNNAIRPDKQRVGCHTPKNPPC